MDDEKWLKQYWRPAVAWQYIAVCLFDFIVAPILVGLYAYFTKTTYVPWISLSLSNGGLYHLSMGAILGVTAWTRGQERLSAMYNNVGLSNQTMTISSNNNTVPATTKPAAG